MRLVSVSCTPVYRQGVRFFKEHVLEVCTVWCYTNECHSMINITSRKSRELPWRISCSIFLKKKLSSNNEICVLLKLDDKQCKYLYWHHTLFVYCLSCFPFLPPSPSLFHNEICVPLPGQSGTVNFSKKNTLMCN